MDKPIMRQTYLKQCTCEGSRVILVDGVLRCASCYVSYGKGGSFYYTDKFLQELIDNAPKSIGNVEKLEDVCYIEE
jgi:hypothetical protein